MEPRFPAGTIITVSPSVPIRNGDLCVATIKNEGSIFKIFHHSGDLKTVTLTSYNHALYPPITLPRESFHSIFRVVRSSYNQTL
jgi:phage repressor protein C with HTH and peptisase S24 domain